MYDLDPVRNVALAIANDYQLRRHPFEFWLFPTTDSASWDIFLPLLSQVIELDPLPVVRPLDPHSLWPATPPFAPAVGVCEFYLLFGAEILARRLPSWVEQSPALGEPGCRYHHAGYEFRLHMSREEQSR